MFFQCKRYKGSVGSSPVRDFRGAMAGRGENGLLITTGTFTNDARAEAKRDGAHSIWLKPCPNCALTAVRSCLECRPWFWWRFWSHEPQNVPDKPKWCLTWAVSRGSICRAIREGERAAFDSDGRYRGKP